MDTPKTLVFDNPGNVQPQSDSAQPVTDSAIAQSSPIGPGTLPQTNPTDQARAGLTERGAPRDLDEWGNQHGELDSFVNDKDMWGEEHFNAGKMQQSKMHLTGAGAQTPLYVIGEPNGLLKPGNINLNNRPVVQNADGSHSSEYSTSFGDEKGREILVPTVVNGKFLTPDGKKPQEGSPEEKAMFKRAQQHYETTHEQMGIFDSAENADTYANAAHNRTNTVQAPNGSRVAFPKDMSAAEMHAHMGTWWDQMMDKATIALRGAVDVVASDVVGNGGAGNATSGAFNATAGAINAVPGSGAALEAGEKYYVNPMDKYLGAVGEGAISSVQSPLAQLPPTTQAYLRSQGVNPNGPMPPWMQGINEATIQFAAQTAADPRMWPLFAENLATKTSPSVVHAILNRALSGAVATQMSTSATAKLKDVAANWDNMSAKDKSAALTGTTLESLMAGLSGYHAAVGSPVAAAQKLPTNAEAGSKPIALEGAPTYAGAERRAGERTLTSPAENELAMKNRRLQDIQNPFDHTEGASATMNRDINKQIPPPVQTINGSGDSAASQEAINRVQSEKSQGIKTYRVDSRSGNAVPVLGVDAPDAHANPYEHIVQVQDGAVKQIQDSGAGARPLDEAKLLKQVAPQDAEAIALKKALSGSAGENSLFAKAKAEPGPDATASEVARRAQAMKTGAPAPNMAGSPRITAPASKAGRSVGAASINDLETKPDVPTFFSKAEQVINEKVSNNASGDAIKSVLQNNGVKADEMKWAGLDDFLKDKPKVSKSELQQFIKENQIQLKDVDLGKTQRFTTRLNEAETDNAEPGRPVVDVIDPKNGLVRFTGSEAEAQDYMSELGQGLSNAEEAELNTLRREGQQLRDNPSAVAQDQYRQNVVRQNELLRKQEQTAPTRPTKYDKWTVPGERENYQEKLLTLPTKESPELQGLRKEYAAAEAARNTYGQTGSGVVPGDVELRFQDAQNAMRKMKNEESTNRDYVAPHFGGAGGDQPTNIVAHVRFDDRPAVDGKKTLFMEEAQSDWHSAGRHEGYKADPKEISKADDAVRQAQDARTNFINTVAERTGRPETNPEGTKNSMRYVLESMTPEERAQYKTFDDAFVKARDVKSRLTQGAVPDAPFKQNWHELVMKRMLRQAAENGYDRLAWTTGDQQADLYDLSKHIGKVEYDPEQGELTAYDPKGKKVIDGERAEPTVKELTPYMGQDLAEKLVDQIENYEPQGGFDEDYAYQSAAEQYGIDERDEPVDEVGEVPERNDFNMYQAEMAKKYGYDPNIVHPTLAHRTPNFAPLFAELKSKLTPEEITKGKELKSAAEEAEKEQEGNRETETRYYVTTNGGDDIGPFDSERAAQDEIHDRVRQDVQYEQENYEPEKQDLPSIGGLDLKRGGEFHRLLYDTMIPSFLKKYAKKWGAEVGTTEIKGMGEPTVDYEGPTKTADDLRDVMSVQDLPQSSKNRAREVLNEMVAHKLPFKDAVLATQVEAERSGYTSGLDHLIEHLGGKFIKSGANQKVHSIEITPAMRQSVMKEGQPIAKKEEKKKPFAAPEQNMEAANFKQRLSDKMTAALA
jgi:hypothetical protein